MKAVSICGSVWPSHPHNLFSFRDIPSVLPFAFQESCSYVTRGVLKHSPKPGQIFCLFLLLRSPFCSFWNKHKKARDRLILAYNHLYGRNISKFYGTVLASVNRYHLRICLELTWGINWARYWPSWGGILLCIQIWARGTKGKNKNLKAGKQRQKSPC